MKMTATNPAQITLTRKQLLKIGIPLWVFVDGSAVGLMTGKDAAVALPAGEHEIGVAMLFQLWKWQLKIGGTRQVTLTDGQGIVVKITDRERWWNILFDIDLVLWAMGFFFTLPTPWEMVYHLLSDGFFAVWLLRVWMIRKKYFVLQTR